MKLIFFFLISISLSMSISKAESRFGDLTEIRDDRMRG